MTSRATSHAAPAARVRAVVAASHRHAVLTEEDRRRMRSGAAALSAALRAGVDVYGMTSGFGPLVGYAPEERGAAHAANLLAHLAVGQGTPLPVDVARLMVRLRLESMRRGNSGVAPARWEELAALHNAGFTPVTPSEGSVSASGDLVPLAHAALAFAGHGRAWVPAGPGGEPVELPAREALARLGACAVTFEARDALAFVNGVSASLAQACVNVVELALLARACAALSGRVAGLLGADPAPYSDALAQLRGLAAQPLAAAWIRAELLDETDGERPLQEPYSVRCSPQVIGAVVDQLEAQGELLAADAAGCSDNPVLVDGDVLHGGNFHAQNVALASDQTGLCTHQLAFLAERQLAVLVDPRLSGGLSPLLSPRPGASSGLAGVQVAATSFVARIRQLAAPCSLTALPTNLWNQDHVPMSLNGALACADALRAAWLVAGSLGVALRQVAWLQGRPVSGRAPWSWIERDVAPVDRDRPLDADVRRSYELLRAWASQAVECEDSP